MKKKWYVFLKEWQGNAVKDTVELLEDDAKVLVDGGIISLKENDEEDNLQDAIKETIGEFRKQLAKEMQEVVKEATNGISVVDAKGNRVPIVVGGLAKAEDSRFGFNNFGDFAKDVVKAFDPRGGETPKGLIDHENYWAGKQVGLVTEGSIKAPSGLEEGLGESAGWLVPSEFSNKIFEKIWDTLDILSKMDMFTVSGNSLEFNGVVENSRVAGQRYGGVRSYWVGEGTQITKSKPKFHRIKLKLNKLAALIYSTSEMLEDSGVALEQMLTKMASQEMAFRIGEAMFEGNGNAKPKGAINAACLVTIARTTADKVKADDVLNMWQRLPAKLRASAEWYINQEVEEQLDRMFLPATISDGTPVGGWPVYLPAGQGFREDPRGSLKGRPVNVTEYNEALGTKGDMTLYDWSQYVGITKGGALGGVRTAMSMHLRFDYDEQVFRFTYRIDGQPWWGSAVTPNKGSNTLSPLIALGDAA